MKRNTGQDILIKTQTWHPQNTSLFATARACSFLGTVTTVVKLGPFIYRLTFRNLAFYVLGRPHRYPPNTPFYIFFQQLYVLNFFKHPAHSPFFSSSKCNLFHNATCFGSCSIRILHTGCAKI
jgi:hypothetical protein